MLRFLLIVLSYLFSSSQSDIEEYLVFTEEADHEILVCQKMIPYAPYLNTDNIIIPFSIPISKGKTHFSLSESYIRVQYPWGRVIVKPRKTDVLYDSVVQYKSSEVFRRHRKTSLFPQINRIVIIQSNIGDIYLSTLSLSSNRMLSPLLGANWRQRIKEASTLTDEDIDSIFGFTYKAT